MSIKGDLCLDPADSGTGVLSFSKIEARLGYQLHRADLLHMDVLHALISPTGLTPARATAIIWIHDNPGTGQSDLARAIGVNRASAMEMAVLLETLGAIERRPGRDRRTQGLWLTGEGVRLHDHFIAATLELDRLIAADLTPAERETFDGLLRRVRASMTRHLDLD